MMKQISFFIGSLFYVFFPTINSYGQVKLVDLVQKSKPAVFIINTYDKDNKPLKLGTGFFIDSKGIALSNYHVFEGANTATITTIDGKIYPINNVISQSKEMDILKFSISNSNQILFPFLNLAHSKPKEGEDVYVIGNPKGLEFSVSNGIVSSIRYDEKIGQIIQTTTPISEGNSGSPLINLNNEVVGIVSFSLIEGQNLNFAISIGNLFSLNEVNMLTFPDLPKSLQNLDVSFKRFEWGTYSSIVRANEKLKFIELKSSESSRFNIDYEATIGNLNLVVSYSFKYDKLISITYNVVNCVSKNNITDCKYYYPTEFHIALSNFITLQEKFIDLFGESYHEVWRFVNQSFSKTSQIADMQIITKTAYTTLNNINLFKEKVAFSKDEFGRIFFAHSWNSVLNNATYQVVFDYDERPFFGVRDSSHKWNCYITVMPLENVD